VEAGSGSKSTHRRDVHLQQDYRWDVARPEPAVQSTSFSDDETAMVIQSGPTQWTMPDDQMMIDAKQDGTPARLGGPAHQANVQFRVLRVKSREFQVAAWRDGKEERDYKMKLDPGNKTSSCSSCAPGKSEIRTAGPRETAKRGHLRQRPRGIHESGEVSTPAKMQRNVAPWASILANDRTDPDICSICQHILIEE
jgi:hypothetical protein